MEPTDAFFSIRIKAGNPADISRLNRLRSSNDQEAGFLSTNLRKNDGPDPVTRGRMAGNLLDIRHFERFGTPDDGFARLLEKNLHALVTEDMRKIALASADSILSEPEAGNSPDFRLRFRLKKRRTRTF